MRPDWNHLQAPRYVWQGRLGIEPTTRGFGDRIASLRTFAPVLRIQLFAFATASERKTVVSPENREAIQLKKFLSARAFYGEERAINRCREESNLAAWGIEHPPRPSGPGPSRMA